MIIWSKETGSINDLDNVNLTKGTYKFTFDFPFNIPNSLLTATKKTLTVDVLGIKKTFSLNYINTNTTDKSIVYVSITVIDNPIPLVAIFGIGILGTITLGLLLANLTKVEKIASLPVTLVVALILGTQFMRGSR